jgi:Uma2 family endonuclease
MKVLARKGDYTFDDFCVLVHDGQKADLIDGVIYMASPDNTNANALSVWLTIVLGSYIDKLDLGQLFTSRVAFRLGKRESPEPDLAVVLKNRLNLVESGFVNGRPDLVIEIVSPESVERDYDKKRRQYEKAGIPEYWIIDEADEKATLLRLRSDGKYQEERLRGGILRSQIVPGFWLRPEWLWQRPAKTAKILEQILARAT